MRRTFSRRSALALAVLAASLAGEAAAQSSQFGIRGPGIPGRGLSARALGTGGSYGLLDPESSQNPAALGQVTTLTAIFTGVQSFRTSENPAGEATGRDSRFPQTMVAGPLRRVPMTIGFGYGTYASRDFSLATRSTVVAGGTPLLVDDTLTSRGGLTDIRLAASYRLPSDWTFGLGLHAITGSNRISVRRVFADSAYLPITQRSEVSYSGVGISLGVTRAWRTVAVAVTGRTDGRVRVNRDTTLVSRIDLPSTVGAGIRWKPAAKLDLMGQGTWRTWSDADADLREQGANGARNSVDLSFGGQFTRDPRRPGSLPLRFGARYATLPFPATATGPLPRETAVALGTGVQFAGNRAAVDLALEHAWRSAGSEYRERAFQVVVGVSIRPTFGGQ
jgi:hypothetical protein